MTDPKLYAKGFSERCRFRADVACARNDVDQHWPGSDSQQEFPCIGMGTSSCSSWLRRRNCPVALSISSTGRRRFETRILSNGRTVASCQNEKSTIPARRVRWYCTNDFNSFHLSSRVHFYIRFIACNRALIQMQRVTRWWMKLRSPILIIGSTIR